MALGSANKTPAVRPGALRARQTNQLCLCDKPSLGGRLNSFRGWRSGADAGPGDRTRCREQRPRLPLPPAAGGCGQSRSRGQGAGLRGRPLLRAGLRGTGPSSWGGSRPLSGGPSTERSTRPAPQSRWETQSPAPACAPWAYGSWKRREKSGPYLAGLRCPGRALGGRRRPEGPPAALACPFPTDRFCPERTPPGQALLLVGAAGGPAGQGPKPQPFWGGSPRMGVAEGAQSVTS